MNKIQLINAVAERTGFSKKDTEVIIKATTDVIEDTTATGEDVLIVGFGKFEKKVTKGATGKIQFGSRKGEMWTTEDGFKPAFSAGKQFKDKVSGV